MMIELADCHRRFEQAVNEGDLEGLLNCFDADAVMNTEVGPIQGQEALRSYLNAWLATAPRIRLDLKALIESGETAVERADCTVFPQCSIG